MSKLYNLLSSIISKVKETEKAIPKKMSELKQDVPYVKSVNGNEPDKNNNVEIEIPEGFSGSWNDLRDRPFGPAIGEVYIVPETTVTVRYISIADAYTGSLHAPYVEFVIGERYIVSIDGTDYTTIAADSISSYTDYPTLSITHNDVKINIYDTGAAYSVDLSGDMPNFTCSIRSQQEIVEKIDETFIPDTIARASDIPTNLFNGSWNSLTDKPFGDIPVRESEILAESEVEFTYQYGAYKNTNNIIPSSSLAEGDTIEVVFDGASYVLTVTKPYCLALGNKYLADTSYENTGEPFCYYTDSTYGFIIDPLLGASTHTVAVYKVTLETKTIEEKYIPGTVKLPTVTTVNDGAFLRVVSGVWTATTIANAEEASF